jgi:glycogen debranching enzyme
MRSNDIYDVKNRLERSMRRYKETCLEHEFVSGYKDVPGIKAYSDGVINGYNNGWMDAAESILDHMRHLHRKYPKMTVNELISHINYEGYEH